MNFTRSYVRIRTENEGNINELLLNFIDVQNNRVFFRPTISSKFKNLDKISSLIIKSIEIISSSSSSTNKCSIDISQGQYSKLLKDETRNLCKIFDKNLKWNFTFEIIKKGSNMIFLPSGFDMELNDLCKYFNEKKGIEEGWNYYSCGGDTVAQCSLGSIFRFYWIIKKIQSKGYYKNLDIGQKGGKFLNN